VLAETKEGLDQVVRERAYLLWEEAGCPEGRTEDFWHQAQNQRFSERLRAVGAGGLSGRQSGRALVSDTRL
jgi:hypothetical protein